MTTTTAIHAVAAARTLARTLLTRRGAVYLPAYSLPADCLPADAASVRASTAAVDELAVDAGVTALEFDLVERGYLVSPDLRAALAAMAPADLVGAGASLLADIDTELGADRPHVPLFRSFPTSTPHDTVAFLVDRVLSHLFQQPEQPCVLCGTDGMVLAVSPCAHLVCRACFDGSDFSGCPICHRRVDVDDPFLTPAASRGTRVNGPLPARLRVLAWGGDHAQALVDAGAELATLLARTGALSATDGDDLAVLLATQSRADVSWVPESVPGRETKARLLAWLLSPSAEPNNAAPSAEPNNAAPSAEPNNAAPSAEPINAASVAEPANLAVVRRLVDTATDVLRILVVRSGGEPGLVEPPRFAAVGRPLRRTLLDILNDLNVALLTEDLRRHRRLWIHAAERLHPFEYAEAFPRVAAAFAALRGTRLRDDAFADTVRGSIGAADTFALVDAEGGQVLRHRSFAARVEAALGAADVTTAIALLGDRPGDFLRRLDHLLRLAAADADAVLAALAAAARGAAPAVLLGALGAIRGRHLVGARRVFFPKGGTARAHLAAEERAALPTATVDAVVEVLTDELLRRAATREPVAAAVIDAGLAGLIAPFTERTASRALVTLPRGSSLALPAGRTLRFFLHWQQATGQDVDLDLSAAMFDASWNHVATCDYTNLRVNSTAAVHSGDLTSAPPPLGASEFLDLDVEQLAAAGVRFVMTAVFSYSGHPFVTLDQAFAGVMALRSRASGPAFDAQAVEQRFDLTGPTRAVVPMVLDLAEGTMRWFDMPKGVTGALHAVHVHVAALALLGEALVDVFGSGSRVGLTELATWHAAARAGTVYVRATDGSAQRFARRDDEPVAAFASRIGSALSGRNGTDHDGQLGTWAFEDDQPGLAFLLRGDLPLAPDAEVYALYPSHLDATAVRLLAAADLAAQLAP